MSIRKNVASLVAAVDAAPAMPKAKRKVEPKAAEDLNLNPAQQAAERNMITLAVSAGKALRKAGEALAECAQLGNHTRKGMTLPEYARSVLTLADVAPSTVYYIADIGAAILAIGPAEAATVKADGALREIASAGRGDAEVMRTVYAEALKAGEGKVTIEAVRKVRNGGETLMGVMDPAEAAAALANKARKYAGGKAASDAAVVALLKAAIDRVQRVAAKRKEVTAKA
jgi:hypothetical protein